MNKNPKWMIGGAILGAIISLFQYLIIKQGNVPYSIDTAIICGIGSGVFIGSISGNTPPEKRRNASFEVIGISVSIMIFQWLLKSIWIIDENHRPHFLIQFVRLLIPSISGILFYYFLITKLKLRQWKLNNSSRP